jgi:phytoene desaturase
MKTVVIGSGFGGLAAAIRLAAKGHQVTVLERRDKPGGRGYVFEQDGFTFDAGPTIITAPFLIDELFELCGKKTRDYVDMFPVDPFYNIRFDDGSVFTYSGDPERMRAEVARVSPEDVEGYETFMRKSAEIFQRGFVDLAHVPFDDVWSMVKVAPSLVKLESFRSVLGLAQKHMKSHKLRQVFSFHPLLVGGDPQHAPAIYAMITFLERKWGVHFARGGMGAVVRALVKLLQDMGGTLRLNAEVVRIEVANKRVTGVTLLGGEQVQADLVVSNADVSWTYQRLIAPEHRGKNTDRRLRNMRYSMGLFLIYFGTSRTYPDLAHHTILLGPRYEGLLDDIFKHKRLAGDFSLYLHAPTRSDPSLAPAGHECFYVLSPVPNLEGKVDWKVEATRYRDRIYEHLEKTCVPDLRKHLVTERLFTPLDFESQLLSWKGAAFSFEPRLTQSAWFRPHNRSEDVEGLYFVGAGTHPGAGLPGVISSAKATVGMIPHAHPTPAAA